MTKTPEEQNIAIALHLGAEWVCSRRRLGYPEKLLVFRKEYKPYDSWDYPEWAEGEFERATNYSVRTPNYSGNLNLIQALVRDLPLNRKQVFWDRLHEQVVGYTFWGDDTTETNCLDCLLAPAAQWCEAYLYAIE